MDERAMAAPVTLTPTDWDVLRLVALGMSDKMIAAVRGTGRQAVTNRLSEINRKLGTRNRVGALRAVGWVIVPDER